MTMTILHLQDYPPGRVAGKAILVCERGFVLFCMHYIISENRRRFVQAGGDTEIYSKITSYFVATKSNLRTHLET